MTTLTNENVAAIDRIFLINGSGPDVRAKVAQQFGITESFAGSIAKALKEKRDNIVTEAAPAAVAGTDSMAGYDRRILESAKDMAIGASVAEAKLAAGMGPSATHNELAALTAVLYRG